MLLHHPGRVLLDSPILDFHFGPNDQARKAATGDLKVNSQRQEARKRTLLAGRKIEEATLVVGAYQYLKPLPDVKKLPQGSERAPWALGHAKERHCLPNPKRPHGTSKGQNIPSDLWTSCEPHRASQWKAEVKLWSAFSYSSTLFPSRSASGCKRRRTAEMNLGHAVFPPFSWPQERRPLTKTKQRKRPTSPPQDGRSACAPRSRVEAFTLWQLGREEGRRSHRRTLPLGTPL